MKVAILGGSSPATPHLFRYLAASARLRDFEFILAGRNQRNLRAVARAASLITHGRIRLQTTGLSRPELRAALCDADVVIIQIRVGGYNGRLHDETFPLQFNVCGDEGLGPGGLAAAWRSWADIRNLLAVVSEVAPQSLVIMVSSPITLLIGLTHLSFPKLRVVGVCELPFTTLQSICAAVGTDPQSTEYHYTGINHLGWFHSLHNAGNDLLPHYASTRCVDEGFPSRELINRLGAVPLKYLRLHYDSPKVLSEQKSQTWFRAQFLEKIHHRTMKVFLNGGVEEVLSALDWRRADWYEQCVGPLLLSLSGEDLPVHFFLTCSPDLEERAYVVRGGILIAIDRSQPPATIADLLSCFIDSVGLGVRAILEQSPALLMQALECHPWTAGHQSIPQIAERIIQGATLLDSGIGLTSPELTH